MEALKLRYPGDAGDWQGTTAQVSANAFAVPVEGQTMHNPAGYPSLSAGSIAIVDPAVPVASGKIVLAKLADSDTPTLKKLIIDGPDSYLVPLNPDYKPIKIDSSCEFIGVVVQVYQDLQNL
jgi:SOS-response transcriptional repressor LexA